VITPDEWGVTWGVIKGCWPAAYLDDVEAKQNWYRVFRESDRLLLEDAARLRATEVETPTIAGLMVTYQEREQDRRRDLRLAAASSPPQEQLDPPAGMPNYEALCATIPAAERERLENQIAPRYAGLYPNRNLAPWKAMWECLVWTCHTHGVDPRTGGYVGSTTLSARDAEERHYQRTLASAQGQMVHEQNCLRCQTYSAPALGHERKGSPCGVGLEYYRPHYAAGVSRP
jgi:hypothetical protein